jgi:hypothetical protein
MILAAAFVLATGGLSLAQDAGISVSDGSQTVELTAAQLMELPQTTIETGTAWTEGKHKFTGPTFAAVLDAAGLAGETVTIYALDGYGVEIPRANLTADGAILTVSMDDGPLPEDKAPYWLIFPYDQSPEMNDKQHQDWSIWAIEKIELE